MKFGSILLSFLVGSVLGGAMLYLGGYLDLLIPSESAFELQSDTGEIDELIEFSPARYKEKNIQG